MRLVKFDPGRGVEPQIFSYTVMGKKCFTLKLPGDRNNKLMIMSITLVVFMFLL